MFKERLQEILEFTKSESPYSKANKGWINKDIFLELGESSSSLSKQKEAIKVILLWPPIQRLISNLLIIITISSLIVLIALKGNQLNLNFGSFAAAFTNKFVQIDTKEANIILEEDKIIQSILNSETEDDLTKEERNILSVELRDEEDSLKLEDNIAKDQISGIEEGQLENIEKNDDKSILSNKKSKSNFF